MRIIGNDPSIPRKTQVVASGTLPTGGTVIVNADGTVSAVAGQSQGVGSATVFESANTLYIAATYDANAQKVVIAYADGGNSNYGTAVVGTVSGNSISFGSPVVFNAGGTTQIHITFDSSNNKVVICYKNDAATENGTAIVGTVSGTSISFGSAAEFETSDAGNQGIIFDSNSNRVVIIYKDGDNSNYGTAIVCTISGTSISFNTPVVFASTNLQRPGVGFDSTNNKIVIAYQDVGNSNKGTAIVGTVSGTSISFGSSVVFDSGALGSTDPAVVYDTNAQKIVIVYQDEYDSYVGSAIVGTVSGTSISFGTAVVFESGTFSNGHACYDAAAQKIVIAYRDHNNSDYGTVIVGTVSGTSISFGSSSVFESAFTKLCSTVFDSNSNKVVIAYQDNANSSHGTALVYQTAYVDQNLTSENYIGMSRGVVFESALSIGATSVVNTGTNSGPTIAYDPNSDRVVIAYKDTSNGHGKAVVGTVSGSGISFGTPATFNAASTIGMQPTHGIAFDSSNNKVVIVYKDGGNSNYGTAIVGTVDPSDNSISFGSEAVFESAHATFPTVVFDSSNNKVLISYSDVGDSSKGKAIVGTVSGTSISFGSAAEFEAGDVNHETLMSTFDSANNKAVIAYRDGGDSNKGKAVVATISGTSVSFGTPVEFTANDFFQSSITFDSTSNKVIIIFPDQGNSQYGTARVGTVSGTSISFGTAVVWHSGSAQRNSVSYSSTADKSIVFFRDGAASDVGKLVELTVSGTSITASSAQQFSATTTSASSSVFDPDNNVIVNAYIDEANSTDLETVQVTGTTITRGEVANSGNASVDIIGSVSDNQLSLTAGQQYFVQNNGTISETADDPSVLAGTAISATELLVKT